MNTDRAEVRAIIGQIDALNTQAQPSRNRLGATKGYRSEMKLEIEAMKAGAQQTLDELFAERLIPFALSAQVVDSLGLEEYIVRFQDARLNSVDVSCPEGQSFKDMVRAAVLDRVSRMGYPLRATVR
ncbi:MAG: hypothetical protein ND895_07300 [Pyrinomonadaceae bacterium]|nr:hypothetical protein [Pyrinomonadaceae bacterium]